MCEYLQLLQLLLHYLIRNAFHIDNELRAYIYADRIEFIEHDPEIDLGNGEILNEFNGRLCVMYLDNTNKITTIEHNSLSMITPRNVGIYRGLIDLIDVEIADLNNYPKIEDKYKTDIYQSI